MQFPLLLKALQLHVASDQKFE